MQSQDISLKEKQSSVIWLFQKEDIVNVGLNLWAEIAC